MDYFLEFHWWYILVALALVIAFSGKSRGGIVVKQFVADIDIVDPRFAECKIRANYSIFKEGQPDHINIDIANVPLPPGDELEFFINRTSLGKIYIEKDNEADFDHWSDDKVYFPSINAGDTLTIRYQDKDIIKGTFS